MNQFANIQNSQGLLKNFYGNGEQSETALSTALKRKRNKLKDSKMGVTDDNGSTGITSQFNNSESKF